MTWIPLLLSDRSPCLRFLVLKKLLNKSDSDSELKELQSLRERDPLVRELLQLQKKDGSLAEPIEYPVTSMPLAVDVGDLNGDTINDLVLITTDSEKPIHVRFGLKTGQLGPVMHFFIERSIAVMLYNLDEAVGDEILTVDAESKRLNCYKYITESQEDADWPIRF